MRYLCFLIATLFSLLLFSQTDTISGKEQEKISKTPFPVVFQEDTLFYLSSGLGPLTAEERARSTEEKLSKIAGVMLALSDSFTVVNTVKYSSILYDDTRILSVSDLDAQAAGTARQLLAEKYASTMQLSFEKHLEQRSLTDWLVQIGFALLTLVGMIVAIYLLNRLFRWIGGKVQKYEQKIKRKRKNILRYLSPRGPEYFTRFLLNVVKYALIILIIFLFLPLLFSFLPWTKEIVHQFYDYISEPVLYVLIGLYKFLPNLFYIIIIIIIARYIVRVLVYVAKEIEEERLKIQGFHKDWVKPTLNIAKVIIYAFALVFMFPYLPGSDSAAFRGVSIFLGILLSLGSTSAIANIVAGIVITYMRPFMIGDRVRIGDTIGDVVEKTMLVTRIRTIKNEDVTIPNATIINNHLWNFTKNASEFGVILHTTITLGYDVPWQEANRLLMLAAKNTKNLTRDFKPFVLTKSLDDYFVQYELNVYTKQPGKMMQFYSELHSNILDAFNEAGIEILSPRYSAVRDGNESTIPKMVVPDTRNPVEKLIDKQTGKEKKEKPKEKK